MIKMKSSKEKLDTQRIRSHSKARHRAALLPPLTKFEVSYIMRYLPAADKLLTLSLLNHEWHQLIKNHYAWKKLPKRNQYCSLRSFLHFLESFQNFDWIAIPDVPEDWCNPEKMEMLEYAESVEFSLLTNSARMEDLLGREILLSKLLSMELLFHKSWRCYYIYSQFFNSQTQKKFVSL